MAEHELHEPTRVERHDYERFPDGVCYTATCSCGWTSLPETTPTLARLAADHHLTRVAAAGAASAPRP